jgi:hypothetical protein
MMQTSSSAKQNAKYFVLLTDMNQVIVSYISGCDCDDNDKCKNW